jgi:hypothetical protein
MKITVAGSLCYDRLIHPDGCRVEGFGGIFYNLVALSSLGRGEVAILPLSHCGMDRKPELEGELREMEGLDPSGIRYFDGATESHEIRYRADGSREEIHRNISPPIAIEHLKTGIDADLILLNFISGCEFSPEDIARMKKLCNCPVFMDLHTLTLGLNENGKRFHRKVKGWEEWIRAVDILQLNEIEMRSLPPGESGDYRSFSKAVLSRGVQVVIITRGQKGAILNFAHDNGHSFFVLPGFPQRVVKDVTGCGDTFSSGFIIEYCKTGDPLRAAVFGNVTAGIKCRFAGIHNLPPCDEVSREVEVWSNTHGKHLSGNFHRKAVDNGRN